ncbi:hypothetical protein [Pseudofrankia sp. BMG5.37]|uniref:hypothetical protein n=1 Tax=Pseudofrankia sp. BMG5.37 TaxID=3050035 RepID=UPI002895365B|nr:hypothetical protein [Pseudofrankia sp. BMG5.37]MDT3439619.1 hypothetical protein [Pseudofrankia sp. BMG5.37]
MPRWLLLFAAYCALAVLMLRSLWVDPGARGYGVSDATLFTWYIGWVPHAIGHGMNPFVTDMINAPDGVSILWSTPVVLLGVLVAPVTLLAGPVAALNTLLTLAPAVSAIAMYGVARRWAGTGPAAVAGLLYGFSPYMVGASLGHLHLTFAPFPPLLLALLHDLLVRGPGPRSRDDGEASRDRGHPGRRSARRTGLLLGLAVAAQALISEELLATSALVGALGLLILAVYHPSVALAKAGQIARMLGWCALVAGVLLAWPLAVQFFGPHRVHGAIQPHDVAVADLFTFVVPTPLQWLAPGQVLDHSLGFTGNAVEVSGYLGVPLLVLLAVLAVRLRRDPLVRVLIPLFVLVALLSLGGHLHVDGRITRVPLPWAAVERLPLLGSALPSRLSLYLTMFAGLALAIWLEQLRFRPSPRRAGAAVLAAAALLPLVPASLHAREMRAPEFFTTAAVDVIPRGSTVLVAPYPRPDTPAAMLWQAHADYRFRLAGCYCTVPAPNGGAQFHGAPSPLTTAMLRVEAGTLTPAEALALPGLREAYAALHPDAVLIGPARNRAALVELVDGLTGHRPVDEPGGVALWAETFRP